MKTKKMTWEEFRASGYLREANKFLKEKFGVALVFEYEELDGENLELLSVYPANVEEE